MTDLKMPHIIEREDFLKEENRFHEDLIDNKIGAKPLIVILGFNKKTSSINLEFFSDNELLFMNKPNMKEIIKQIIYGDVITGAEALDLINKAKKNKTDLSLSSATLNNSFYYNFIDIKKGIEIRYDKGFDEIKYWRMKERKQHTNHDSLATIITDPDINYLTLFPLDRRLFESFRQSISGVIKLHEIMSDAYFHEINYQIKEFLAFFRDKYNIGIEFNDNFIVNRG